MFEAVVSFVLGKLADEGFTRLKDRQSRKSYQDELTRILELTKKQYGEAKQITADPKQFIFTEAEVVFQEILSWSLEEDKGGLDQA